MNTGEQVRASRETVTVKLTRRQAVTVLKEMERPAGHGDEASYRRRCIQIVNRLEDALGLRRSKYERWRK